MKKFIILLTVLLTGVLYSNVLFNEAAMYLQKNYSAAFKATIIRYSVKLFTEQDHRVMYINEQSQSLVSIATYLDVIQDTTMATEEELVENYTTLFGILVDASYPGTEERNIEKMGKLDDDEIEDLIVFEVDWSEVYKEFLKETGGVGDE